MDRRDFLKTTSAAAAAAAAGTAVTGSASAEIAAPTIAAGVKKLKLAMPWPDDGKGFGDSARRLARRVETATDGRYRVSLSGGASGGIEALRRGDADLYHASEHDHVRTHPALAYFAGLPSPLGLEPELCEAWLLVGGGQMLWDDLAADFGVKPLLAGHAGRTLLWSVKPMRSLADIAGQKIFAMGLARDVLHGIGAKPATVAPLRLAGALASGELSAAEWGGTIASLAAGLPEVARYVTASAINATGTAVTLGIRRSLWESLSAADQAVIAACASEEARLTLAEDRAHRALFDRVLAEPKGIRRYEPSPELDQARSRVASAVVAHTAGTDRKAGRINASYMAFRKATVGRDGPAADAPAA